MKVLALILCISFAADAWALECTPRPSCEALGFTDEDKSNWCGKEIFCPTDSKYTACVEAYENPCPNGYDNRILSVNDCGEQGSNGWTYASTTVSGKNGQDIRCGKCMPNECSSSFSASYQDVSDCSKTQHPDGWIYTTCYEGNKKLGKCDAKTCYSHGFHEPLDRDSGKWLCREYASHVYLGDTESSCYDCVSCALADEFGSSSYTDVTYRNQDFSTQCKHGTRNVRNGLYGCYRTTQGSDNYYYYTAGGTAMYKGKCDYCEPISSDPANNGEVVDSPFCCKNGVYEESIYSAGKYYCN